MSSLALIDCEIYVPGFNENTDEYFDKCPYRPYERNCIRYECRCKAGAHFMNNASFKQHIKSRTHKDFIENYKKYYKEVDEAQDTIKQLRTELELLKRKNTSLKNQNMKLLEIIEDMNDEDNFEDCL
jgi:FtsZ-binding cell division protein ZapB|tara:strand:+ start:115 stop:495 length:381 start_codon:yes stop_codon:yes gene_type:complete